MATVGTRSFWRGLVVAVSTTGVAVLPVYFVGALAVQMQQELGFGESGLGAALASFFAASAMSSVPMGRLAERLGPVRSTILSATFSGTALLGIGVLARSWALLMLFMLVAGVGNGMAAPAANLGLTRLIRYERWGAAFGIKQAAVPGAALMAGISLPVIGLTIGWRWTFVVWLAAPLALIASMSRLRWVEQSRTAKALHARPRPARLGVRQSAGGFLGLVLLALGGGLGAAAANSLGGFLVSGLVAATVAPPTAGLLLALGSVSSVVVRAVVGWAADRAGSAGLVITSAQCGLGAIGFLMLGFGRTTPVILAGTVVAFAAGWGWSGVYTMAVIKLNPGAPAAMSGVMHAGTYAGGVFGPLAFGIVVERFSYTTAWTAGAISLSASAGLMLSLHLLNRSSTE